MATIKDVAAIANVSVATVSRVINNETNVNASTREQVLLAINELNYTPNLLGRNLRRLETKKILVLLNTISNQFHSRIVKGIEECAISGGYTVMICMTHGDATIEAKHLQLLKTRLVDGAIFLTIEADGASLSKDLTGVSVVQACESKQDFNTPLVSIDDEQAAYDATCYLLQKGHNKIAFFGAGDLYHSSSERCKGYKRALLDNDILVRNDWILSEGFSFNAGIRAANTVMGQGDLPTAIFCASDSCAAGAIKTFAQNGLSTPEDISIMGFDDTQLSQIYTPAITTTRQPQYDIGYKAMELLLKRINNQEIQQKKITLCHQIIERESVISYKRGRVL